MKKKITVVALVLSLLAIFVVGGTLAWFMDSDEATNVFTIGSVEIEQIEQQRKVDENGVVTDELEPFVNDKQLIPVINDNNAKNDVNFQDKIVTVKNIGKNDAYVQTFVAVPSALVDVDAPVLKVQIGLAGGWTKAEETWTVQEKDILGEGDSTASYTVFKYVYDSILAAKADNATEYPVTTPAIDGVFISQATDMDVTYREDGSIESAYFVMNGEKITGFDATQKINVYVASQAIQARGFSDAETALEQFGDHPWVTTTP